MSGRIDVTPGDFWADDLGRGYQVTLLFNIIHMPMLIYTSYSSYM